MSSEGSARAFARTGSLLQPARLILLAAGVAIGANALAGTLQGSATLREAVALPADAVFEATLEDVSLADARSRVLGRSRIDPAGAPPFRFAIAYDDAAIQARHRYIVRATIRRQGRLLFTTDQAYPVLDGRDAPLQLVLVTVRSSAAAPSGGALRKRDGQGRPSVTGMFTYMADAAQITLCADGRRMPVAMEGDYLALESTYTRIAAPPGQPLLVGVEGLITLRPSMETGRPPQTTLVVERFVGIYPRLRCGDRITDSALRGTYWKLLRVDEEPAPAMAKEREPHLLFASDALQVAGSGGCNRIIGSFETEGERLRFGNMAATMMACPEGMDIERRLLNTLAQIERYRVRGSLLELLDASGAVRARFEAIAQR